MGKNYKQQAIYDYIHGNKSIKDKLLMSIFKKWVRHNFSIGKSRMNRIQIKSDELRSHSRSQLESLDINLDKCRCHDI